MIVRKFGILLVSVTGLMAWGGVANADTAVPDTQISQVLWGAGSVADTTSAQTATQPATTVADPDKTVCRTMDPATGSRLGARRECHTQAQWDAMSRENQQQLTKAQGMGYQTNQTPGH
jgi:hypothetical protein